LRNAAVMAYKIERYRRQIRKGTEMSLRSFSQNTVIHMHTRSNEKPQ
jgi:hypothetical protein